jgi:2TM family of unknown function (DUF5676)
MMNLNAIKFGWASAISFSIAWLVCSLLVWIIPDSMMRISGGMLHLDLSTMGWHMSLVNFSLGLVGWALTAGIIGWLLAAIYNKLITK